MSGAKEIVYGRIPVLECLKAGRRRPSRLFVQVTAHGIEEVLAAAKGVPVEHVDRFALDRMTQAGIHQGVVLETELAPVLDLEDLLEGDEAGEGAQGCGALGGEGEEEGGAEGEADGRH